MHAKIVNDSCLVAMVFTNTCLWTSFVYIFWAIWFYFQSLLTFSLLIIDVKVKAKFTFDQIGARRCGWKTTLNIWNIYCMTTNEISPTYRHWKPNVALAIKNIAAINAQKWKTSIFSASTDKVKKIFKLQVNYQVCTFE